jgi:hypothetical protein
MVRTTQSLLLARAGITRPALDWCWLVPLVAGGQPRRLAVRSPVGDVMVVKTPLLAEEWSWRCRRQVAGLPGRQRTGRPCTGSTPETARLRDKAQHARKRASS